LAFGRARYEHCQHRRRTTPGDDPGPPHQVDLRRRRRYTYSALAIYFAPVFFPNSSPTAQLLNTSAIFAVGFLARPLGSWLMGMYADRVGRKAAMTISVLLMSFGAFMIAVCPTYASIGVAAPTILLIARLLQGLSVGGEYGTSATYLSEIALEKHRGFYSSFQYVSLVMGQLASLGIIVVLQQFFLAEGSMEAWGWRIPFFVAAAGALVAFYLRRNIDETESFHANEHRTDKGTIKALMKHPRELITVVGLTLGGTICFYTYTTYMQKFMVNTAGFDRDTATMVSMSAIFVFMCVLPLVGALSDIIGRRPVLMMFGLGASLMTYPVLTAIGNTDSAMTAFLLNVAALLVVSCYSSINAVVKAEMFPAHIRALGVGLPFAITVSLFGGTVEFVALKLKEIGHEPWFFFYVSGCAVVSLITYSLMKDTKKTSLIKD
jgi:MHS family alpha-ketoglutarate permease-like MFS transporter